MGANAVLVPVLSFGLGMALQGLIMLRGRLRRGDGWRAAGVLGVGLFGMIPGKNEPVYALMHHVLYAFLLAAVTFVFLFRDRILRRIGGRLLLAWNILLVYVALTRGWTSPVHLALLLAPTAPTVLNAFTDIDRHFGWKVFFHAWFLTILVVLAIVGFDTGPLDVFWNTADAPPVTLPPLQMIAGGAAFLYVVANMWFVLALAPIPLRDGQRWGERMVEVRRHMELLARGYVWERDDVARSTLVLVGLPLALFAITWWGVGDPGAAVPAAIALMPWATGREAADEAPPEPEPGPARVEGRRQRRAKPARRSKR